MSQYRDISRKPDFGPNLGLNGPILGRNIFFGCNDLHYLLDIIAVYHNMQNQRNLMIQTRENGLKPQIWAILGPFCQILGQEIFFWKSGLRHFKWFYLMQKIKEI